MLSPVDINLLKIYNIIRGGKMYKNIIIIAICAISSIHAGSLRATANPSQRSMAAMITDTLNGRIILFGGQSYGSVSNQYFNDLWSLNLQNETWKPIVVTGTLPPKRRDATLAYYSERNHMLLFGGRYGSTFFNDIWALNVTVGSEHWTQLNPSGTPPSPRTGVAGIMDPINNRLILFGGKTDDYTYVNETWEVNLDTLTWRMLTPSGALPAPRNAYAAVYDSDGHRMIVFSGATTNMINDVWALDLTYGNEQWHQLNPTGIPPQSRARSFYTLDYINNRMVVGFGFDYPPMQLLSDAWVLDLDSLHWRRILTSNLVEPRRGSCAAFNPRSEQVIIFGGDNMIPYAETYSLTTDTLGVYEDDNKITISSPYIKLLSNPSRIPCKMSVFITSSGNTCLKVFDISGRLVKTLISDNLCPGSYNIQWDGKDGQDQRVSAGTYFIQLEIDGQSVVKKTVVIE